ncbi:MAG TPA: glucose-6-phosphate isomerase family protein [Bacteroidota bacterium]|nr:glucose-6-phosphate isomerase family protein [Bacteroidota bacterium]
MISIPSLLAKIDYAGGTIDGCAVTRRTLSQLGDAFADPAAVRDVLAHGDPLMYTVSTCEYGEGSGSFHCGLGVLYPGTAGEEFFMTRGHMHARKEAPELYIGIRGQGLMLMQREDGSEPQTVSMSGECLLYVPGHMAHRTVNVGSERLIYLGIYAADAGHDYESVRKTNFTNVVLRRGEGHEVVPRAEYLRTLPNAR